MQRLKINSRLTRAAVLLLLMMLTAPTAWAEIVGDASGTCGANGDNLTWTLTENDENTVTWANGTTGHTALTLTISGTGAMADYAYQGAPWNSDRQSVTRLVLPDGMTHVGNYAFDSFYNVKSITLPAAVTSIGTKGFYGGGNKTSGCTFTAAEGSQLSSIGTEAFHNYYGNVDLSNCKSLTSIGADVFKGYIKKTLTLPVSMRTVAANAIYPVTQSSDKPEVYVSYDNSIVTVVSDNDTYMAHGTGTIDITNAFNIQKESSVAVSIEQYFFAWNSTDEYFEIADEQDLIDLGNLSASSTANHCEGLTFKLTADLDFTDMPTRSVNGNSGNFHPIGLVENASFDGYFSGHFDGQNHTIKALRYTNKLVSGTNNNSPVGLFKKVNGSSAVVERVILIDPQMSGKASGCGGIAGVIQNGATIRNCTVLGGSITHTGGKSGGIVGSNSSYAATIEACTVIGTSVQNGMIIGYANSQQTIKDCIYYAPTDLGIAQNGYTNGGGNQRVYQLTLGDDVTATGATYSTDLLPGKAYCASGQAVTIGYSGTMRDGYDLGYTVNGAAIDGNTFSITADATVAAAFTPDPAHFSQSGDEYTIHTAEGWGVFCDALQDNDTYNRFSGKTVKLGADITVSRMAGSSGHEFTGTFDGNKNTLTFNYGSDNEPTSEEHTAPFRYVGVCTINDLHVAGDIYTSAKCAAGVVAQNSGKLTIENCLSSVNIHSTVSGDGTHGGFVAATAGQVAITGCAFNGSLLGENTEKCGGFIGWRNTGAEIRNSLFIPTEVTVKKDGSATFARNKVDTYNCYYTYELFNSNYSPSYAPFDPEDADHPDKYNNGHARHTVSGGEGVTISGIALVGEAKNTYDVSGITAYAKGITRGDEFYYGSGDEVSLTLSNTAPTGLILSAYTATAGTLSSTENSYTLTMPDDDVEINAAWGVTYLDENGNTQVKQPGEYTLLTGTEHQLTSAGWYIAAGTLNYTDYIELTANGDYHFILADDCQMTIGTSENRITKKSGIYSDISNNSNTIFYGQSTGDNLGTLTIYNGGEDGCNNILAGNITINGGNIIGDNTSNANSLYAYKNVTINGGKVNADKSIYANENVTINGGTVSGIGIAANYITINGGNITSNDLIYAYKTLTINGGNVEATGPYAIQADKGFIYAGGNVTASSTKTDGSGYAIWTSGCSYTFTWSKPTDCITIGNGGLSTANGTETAIFSKLFKDADGNYYGGTLTGTELNALVGKTLSGTTALALANTEDNTARIAAANGMSGLDVTLTGRTLYKDGAWNTLCLPFNVSTTSGPLAGDNVVAMTLNISESNLTGTTLTLNFTAAETIPAGTPFIIKWGTPESHPNSDLNNPVFTGVTINNNASTEVTFSGGKFKGTYDPIEWATENKSILFLGSGSTLYYPKPNGDQNPFLNAFRAYFDLDGASAREFVLNFDDGEATGIKTTNSTNYTNSDAWYDMSGRKLSGKPTKAGLYIHEGKKVSIK